MELTETQSVTANLCGCKKSHKYVVSGNKNLFMLEHDENRLVLVTRSKDEGRKGRIGVLDSILVFCDCDHLTIHYPETYPHPDAPTWKSRKMWKRWRRYSCLEWPMGIPNAEKTLKNVWRLSVTPGYFKGRLRRELYLLNVPEDNHNIHKNQRNIACSIFSKLLTCQTNGQLRRTVDYYLRDCDAQASFAMITIMKQLGALKTTLPVVVQEKYNLRGISQSGRLRDLRIALQNLCAQAGIELPELIKDDTGQSDIIKELVS